MMAWCKIEYQTRKNCPWFPQAAWYTVGLRETCRPPFSVEEGKGRSQPREKMKCCSLFLKWEINENSHLCTWADSKLKMTNMQYIEYLQHSMWLNKCRSWCAKLNQLDLVQLKLKVKVDFCCRFYRMWLYMNTSLAALGVLAHCLQHPHRLLHQKWPTRYGKGSNPRLLGAPINFR